MAGLFQALEVGKRALLSSQVYLQTIGHNIANVNTPGYSRQRVHISATRPSDSPYGPIGTGMGVDSIRHVRDLFLGEQFRQTSQSVGEWTYKEKVLSQLETVFAEPADNTLNERLNEFWNSWDTLSQHAESMTSRKAVLGAAERLVTDFRELSRQLTDLRDSIDGDLTAMTQEVNRLSTEVAMLNQQIVTQELDGSSSNDLRDIRDQLIDELSLLVNTNTIEDARGGVRVLIGSLEIVNGSNATAIDTETHLVEGGIRHRLIWEGTSVELTCGSGELRGLLDSRDILIPKYLEELDALAASVVYQVNSIHSTGYGLDGIDGRDFFDSTYTTASSMRINQELELAPEKLAASASGETGDGTIALNMQGLRNERVMVNGTSTINDYYNSMIGDLGLESHQAMSFASNYKLLVHQVENSRQSIQGVSLDEEMASMIKHQHAYEAAARVITVMDEALDVVISRMGIVGR
ncbi:MAG: flagellar hook-associated protein FlgK [candidate division Zixibacteria bacterium]|nr:flagellar hook-associated protein FlgK [candidate division Zixibacteria bacterium]